MWSLTLLLISLLLNCVLDANTHPIHSTDTTKKIEGYDIHDSYVPKTSSYNTKGSNNPSKKIRASLKPDSQNNTFNCEEHILCKNLKNFHKFSLFILFFHWPLHDIQPISMITEETRVSKFLKLSFHMAMVLKIVMTIKLLPQMTKLFSYRSYL